MDSEERGFKAPLNIFLFQELQRLSKLGDDSIRWKKCQLIYTKRWEKRVIQMVSNSNVT